MCGTRIPITLTDYMLQSIAVDIPFLSRSETVPDSAVLTSAFRSIACEGLLTIRVRMVLAWFVWWKCLVVLSRLLKLSLFLLLLLLSLK